MTHIIVVIPNPMFPKAPLPDSLLSLYLPALARGAVKRIVACPGKNALDQHPARRKIIVIRRQRPEAMKMVRKQDDCIDREWMPVFYRFKCLLQQSRVIVMAQYLLSFMRHHRKEVCGPRHICSSIAHLSYTMALQYHLSCWASQRTFSPTYRLWQSWRIIYLRPWVFKRNLFTVYRIMFY
jgi:hypothetical protein